MSPPSWLPTTAVTISPEPWRRWRTRRGRRTQPSASIPDPRDNSAGHCSNRPSAERTSSTCRRARRAGFGGAVLAGLHGAGAVVGTQRRQTGQAGLDLAAARRRGTGAGGAWPNSSMPWNGPRPSPWRAANSLDWDAERRLIDVGLVHQPVGGAADADRRRRARPGTVQRPHRHFRRQLRRHADPPRRVGKTRRLRPRPSRERGRRRLLLAQPARRTPGGDRPERPDVPRRAPPAWPGQRDSGPQGPGPPAAQARRRLGGPAACNRRPAGKPVQARPEPGPQRSGLRFLPIAGHHRSAGAACRRGPRPAQRRPHPSDQALSDQGAADVRAAMSGRTGVP